MSDITQAIEQDAISDSLVAPLESESQFVEQYGEHESGEEHGGQERSDDWQQINDELRAETARLQERPEQEAAQPVEVTPQAIQEGLQQLDQAVNELGLNDPAEATILASALGVDPANSVPLGTVMAKTTLSALHVLEQAGGDLSKIGPIPRESAVAFSNDFLRALGMDPRMSQANPEQLASVVLSGTLSFLKAVETYGVNASL